MNRFADDVLAGDRLLTPAEVARMFGVNTKQPARWARAGLLPCVWTPGGHRRFRLSEVRARIELSEDRAT